MNKTKYQVIRLDESESIPYFFQFKTDAVKVAVELNKNNNQSQYYVKEIKPK